MYQQEIADIIPILENSGTILYPTDTIWSIGCNAFDEIAIQKITKIHPTSTDENFTLLISDITMLENYIQRIHPRIYALHDYHERPVTVVYENPKNLPDSLLSKEGSITIRIVKDDFCKALIQTLGNPIIAVSAKINDEFSAAIYDKINEAIKNGVDYIAKYRREDTNKTLPAVVVKLGAKNEFEVLKD